MVTAMVEMSKHEFDGSASVTFECLTPADEAVLAAGHEPNGYFWEGVAQRLLTTQAPQLLDAVGFDAEGSMFCAYGDGAALDALSALMTPVINDAARVREVISEAKAAGFQFDD